MAEIEAGFPDPHSLVVQGPTLSVRVGFDPNFEPNARRVELPEPPVNALVDTGATYSCIDSALARERALPVIGRGLVAGAHGALEANQHLAQIYIPSLNVTVHGRFYGIHLRVGGQFHDALLGRSFLRLVTMRYDGPTGSVVISR